MHTPRLRPQDFPDSPYAQELAGGVNALRFQPTLEREFRAAHLVRAHRQLQSLFLLTLFAALSVVVQQSVAAARREAVLLVATAAVLATSAAALLWVIGNRVRQDRFDRFGGALIALFNGLVASLVAQAIVSGRFEDLAVLTANVVAMLAFSGLLFRPALAVAVCSVAAFAGTGALLGMPPRELLDGVAITALTAAVAGVLCHGAEAGRRVEFLEAALLDARLARDAFDEHLTRIWKHALRERRSITVFLIDVGSDTRGAALHEIGRAVQDYGRRPLDMAARYDGSHFAVVLYDLTPRYVSDMAERLLQRISCSQNGAIPVNIGASLAVPAMGRAPEHMLQLAAEALQDAERAGGNRVVFKGEHSFAPLRTGAYKMPRAGRLARIA